MTLVRQVARNTIANIVGKAISVILGIFTLALITRYLGAERFGWFITVTTFLQIFGTIADAGLTLITSQMISERGANEERLIKNLFSFRLTTATVFLGSAPLVALFFPYPTPIKAGIALAALSFFFVALQQIYVGLLQKHLAMRAAAWADVLGRVAMLGAVLAIVRFDFAFLPIMGTLVLANGIQLAVLARAARAFTRISFVFDRVVWREIMRRSYPLALSIVFNMIYLRADIFIMSLLRTQGEVGLYGAAYRVLDILIQMLPFMFMGLVLPLMSAAWSAGDRAHLKRLIQRAFDFLAFAGLPVVIGGILLADKVMALVAGNDFAASGPLLSVLLIAFAGGSMASLFGHVVVALNLQRRVIWIYVFVAVSTLLLYLMVIPRFGAHGAAWATVYSEYAAGGILAVYIMRALSLKLSLALLARTIGATTAMMGTILLVQPLPIIYTLVLAGAVYVVAAYLFGIIKKDMLKEILAPSPTNAT